MGKKLYIGNLSFMVDSNQLSDVFAECGTVDSVNVITDRDTARSKGFAFIEMSSDSEAQAALQKFNGYMLEGRAMNVSEAKPQENRTDKSKSFRRGSFSPRSAY